MPIAVVAAIAAWGTPGMLAADAPAAGPATMPVVSWGAEREGYSISIASDKNEYHTDECIWLKMTLRVNGPPVKVRGTDEPLIQYIPRALRSDGKDAPLTLYTQNAVTRIHEFLGLTLSDGATDQDTIPLSRACDMSLSGTYKVTVTRELPRRENSKETVKVTSNIIVVKVLDTPTTRPSFFPAAPRQ